MEHFGGQLTTSASGRTVVPSQDGVFMKALDSIWEIPVKMRGRLVRHARRLVFQLAEVAVPREVFRQVLERIGGLHAAPG